MEFLNEQIMIDTVKGLGYSPICIRRGVYNRRGGSGKISKMLQEGGHFPIRGGSDKPKTLQEGGLNRRGGRTHFTILQQGAEKINKISQFI